MGSAVRRISDPFQESLSDPFPLIALLHPLGYGERSDVRHGLVLLGSIDAKATQ